MVQLAEAPTPAQPERPMFHVAPKQGWVNDPNGPLYFRGKYHLFYQHLNQGCEWAFGLVWGHAVSSDLVHWEHLPDALIPSPRTLDADGCFSGCATVDTDGTPIILYTGVRLRTNPDAAPLPPPDCDLHLPFIESQLYAVADPEDPHLVSWDKELTPFLPLPPPAMDLTGWRDPFVLEKPCEANGHNWVVLIGSGIKNVGGTALVYRASDLRKASAWVYDGLLCLGDGDTGAVWECPLVAELPPLPPASHAMPSHTLGLGQRRSFSQLVPGDDGNNSNSSSCNGTQHVKGLLDERYTHFYSISPDACTNPSLYWLGRYEGGRFDLPAAKGPLRLDLGDVLYAPNIFTDERDRLVLWGWLQERRTVGTYDYAGCMGVPRLLYLNYDSLWQEPLPEIKSLRNGEAWHDSELLLAPSEPVALPRVWGAMLDLEVTFRQGSAAMVGLLIRSYNASGEGGAAVLYNWETQVLEVVFEALDPATMAFSLTAPLARHIGGRIAAQPGQPLLLRLLLDYSSLEVFTGTGEVLSTRVYRGTPPPGADAGLEFVAIDGTATIARVSAHEMRSIWKGDTAAAAAGAEAAAEDKSGAALVEELLETVRSRESLAGKEGGSGLEQEEAELERQLSRSVEHLGGLLGGLVVRGDSFEDIRPQGVGLLAGEEHLEGLGAFDMLSLGALDGAADHNIPEEEMTADIFMDVLV